MIEENTHTHPPKQGCLTKLFITIVILALLAIALMWLYGYYQGKLQVEKGINFITYYLIKRDMNPITSSGFTFYMQNNTDFYDILRNIGF